MISLYDSESYIVFKKYVYNMKELVLQEKNSTSGLRNPSEVISAHYILNTEQSRFYVKISKIISSIFMVFVHIFLLGISSFLVFWWGISYPNITISAWYYLLTSLIFLLLLIEVVLRWYTHYINFKLDILSTVLWFLSLIFISIASVLPRHIGYFIGEIGQVFLFFIIILNITRAFLFRKISKAEESDAQKIMEIHESPSDKEFNNKRERKLTDREDKSLFNDEKNSEYPSN